MTACPPRSPAPTSTPSTIACAEASARPTRRAAAASLLAGLALPALAWPVRAATATASATAFATAASEPDRLAEAVSGSQRSPANRARDGARHPYETLRFFGVEPQHTVIEVAPGGGWFTEILAPYLRDRGRLVAAHYPADSASEETRSARARFEAKLAASPAVYGQVVLATIGTDGGALRGLPAGLAADRVLTFRNLHNWIETEHLAETLRSFHAALKPGGILGIEDHRAVPGTPPARAIATGYVPEALVIAAAEAAGFTWLGKSEVNANPRDSHEHPEGVWSLPPTLRGDAAGRAGFLAIGESDRMTLSFLKPSAGPAS